MFRATNLHQPRKFYTYAACVGHEPLTLQLVDSTKKVDSSVKVSMLGALIWKKNATFSNACFKYVKND